MLLLLVLVYETFDNCTYCSGRVIIPATLPADAPMRAYAHACRQMGMSTY